MPGRYTPPIPKSQQEHLIALQDGVLVERDVLNIVEKIHDYDPSLQVRYLDPNRAGAVLDAPYQIIEHCPDGIDRVVCAVWELDERVYERIVAGDTLRNDVQQMIDKANERARKAVKDKDVAEREALQEMVADVVKSPKDTYTATNPVTEEKHKFTSLPQEK